LFYFIWTIDGLVQRNTRPQLILFHLFQSNYFSSSVGNLVRTSASIPVILVVMFRGFLQYLQVNAGIIRSDMSQSCPSSSFYLGLLIIYYNFQHYSMPIPYNAGAEATSLNNLRTSQFEFSAYARCHIIFNATRPLSTVSTNSTAVGNQSIVVSRVSRSLFMEDG
jgi:hypothetical protein